MTITEDLSFSVLTAPIATVDRRVLSQAWYSALYHGARKPDDPKAAAVPQSCGTARRGRVPANPADRSRGGRMQPAHLANGVKKPEHGGLLERRSEKSTLARKIERTLMGKEPRPHGARFSIAGEHGRVHVLIRAEGLHVKLVAICARSAATQVAQALAHARYALALRGIRLDAETQERGAC